MFIIQHDSHTMAELKVMVGVFNGRENVSVHVNRSS